MMEKDTSRNDDVSDQELPGTAGKDYNQIFEIYVEDLDNGDLDIVGLLAYSLYKRQKRDWIVQFRKLHDGRPPDEHALSAVTGSYLTNDMQQTLRDRASDILSKYGQIYVEASERQIREDALNNEVLRQARSIEESLREKSGFWNQVWTGFIATAIWTFLVTAIIAGAAIFGSDLIDGYTSAHSVTSQ